MSQLDTAPTEVPLTLTFDLELSRSNCISGMGGPIVMEQKGMGVNRMPWCKRQPPCDLKAEETVRDRGDLRCRRFHRLILVSWNDDLEIINLTTTLVMLYNIYMTLQQSTLPPTIMYMLCINLTPITRPQVQVALIQHLTTAMFKVDVQSIMHLGTAILYSYWSSTTFIYTACMSTLASDL